MRLYDNLTAAEQRHLSAVFEQWAQRFELASTTINARTQEPWDSIGIQRFTKMLENIRDTGTITPGEFEYIFDRTHPQGRYPRYNRHCGLHRRLADMPVCPVATMIKIVDWDKAPNNKFRRRLTQELGYDIPRRHTAASPVIPSTYNDLFTEANS